jgi:hypothetical protein
MQLMKLLLFVLGLAVIFGGSKLMPFSPNLGSIVILFGVILVVVVVAAFLIGPQNNQQDPTG